MRTAANHFFLDMEIREKWRWTNNEMTVGVGSPFLSTQVYSAIDAHIHGASTPKPLLHNHSTTNPTTPFNITPI